MSLVIEVHNILNCSESQLVFLVTEVQNIINCLEGQLVSLVTEVQNIIGQNRDTLHTLKETADKVNTKLAFYRQFDSLEDFFSI